MGYDLVTWAPAIGGSGDDLYNIPGAKKLDATTDTGAQTPILAGDSSGFSATPTIAQLNASSHFNQVVGLYNRRKGIYNTAFGTSLATASYVSAGAKVLASDYTGLLSKINTLRSQEGFTGGALAWPNTTPTAGARVSGDHLAYLRKALAISGSIKFIIDTSVGFLSFANVQWANGIGGGGGNLAQYSRLDNPYNTHSAEVDDATYTGSFNNIYAGKICPSSSAMDRFRILIPCAIPEVGSATVSSATLTLNVGAITTTLESFSLGVYGQTAGSGYQPSLTPGYAGTAYDLNKQAQSGFAISTTGVKSVTMGSPWSTSFYAGGYMVLILGQAHELANDGSGISSGNHSYIQLTNSTTDHYLTINF